MQEDIPKKSFDISLVATDAELFNKFSKLQTRSDVANLLEVNEKALIYWLYRQSQSKKYYSFNLIKKSGELREINAPIGSIKILQNKLNKIFKLLYKPKPSVHGFIKIKKKKERRSIVTNARAHVRKRFVLNIDIQDFFPSINFGRVYGMLKSEPFNLPSAPATVLAQICCLNNCLPQGASTSPIISNLVCRRLDVQLQKLAKQYRCTYTRYADDITISTTLKDFPRDIAYIDNSGKTILGKTLINLINDNGFEINQKKIRLQNNQERQVVTGLIVNNRLNLNRKFVRQVRAMLHSWEKYGEEDAQKVFYEKYNTRQRLNQENQPLYREVLAGKINFIKMVRGQEDGIYRKLHNKFCILTERPKDILPIPESNNLFTYSQSKIMNMIIKGECDEIEFKETMLFCIKRKQLSEDVTFSCLKTIAGFLNSKKGGTLLIGVSDSKVIKGIDRDCKFCQNKNRDGFELRLRELISNKLIPLPLGYINIEFEYFSKGIICAIKVKPCETVIHLDNKVFLRDGNRTISLEGIDLTTWLIGRHSHKKIDLSLNSEIQETAKTETL